MPCRPTGLPMSADRPAFKWAWPMVSALRPSPHRSPASTEYPAPLALLATSAWSPILTICLFDLRHGGATVPSPAPRRPRSTTHLPTCSPKAGWAEFAQRLLVGVAAAPPLRWFLARQRDGSPTMKLHGGLGRPQLSHTAIQRAGPSSGPHSGGAFSLRYRHPLPQASISPFADALEQPETRISRSGCQHPMSGVGTLLGKRPGSPWW